LLRSVKYGIYGAVLAGLVGGTVAWQGVDKTVSLVVDGQATKVHTTASHVGGVLVDAGYRVRAHDIVAPDVDASVHDNGRIVYKRGRLLHLDVNGVHKDVWTTAPTVAAALAQLGYSTADFTSVSRAKRLPLSPTDLTVRTPRLVTVVHDGKTQQVTTTDATVAQLLSDLQIALGPKDTVSALITSALTPNQTLVVKRVKTANVTATKALPFKTTRVKTSALPAGQTKLVKAGKNGVVRITYALVYIDGTLIGKTAIKTVVVRAPITRVIKVGTGSSGGSSSGTSSGTSSVYVSPGSAQAIAKQLAAARGWGDDQFSCLVTLWNHESGWNVHAANPSGAYGIPQALPGSKMGSAGPDWQNNATTQIKWGLGYIAASYGTPCGAWSSWQAKGWY
jgi:uncharacterized protein YabE (DUF348 family)